MKRAWMAVSILVFASGFVGCKKAEPPSLIVKKVEDAGSGELSQATTKSIYDWFNKHQELAKEIKKECTQLKVACVARLYLQQWSETNQSRQMTRSIEVRT